MTRPKEFSVNHAILYVLLLVSELLAFLSFWSLLNKLLSLNSFTSTAGVLTNFTLIIVAFVAMIAIYIVIVMLESNLIMALVVYLLASLVVFILPFTPVLNVIFAVIVFLLLSMVHIITRGDLKIYAKLHISRIFSSKLTLIVTVLSFVLASQFYLVSSSLVKGQNLAIPESMLDNVFSLTQPLISDQIQSQKEAFLNEFSQQLSQQYPLFDNVSQEDKLSLLEGNVPPQVAAMLQQQGYSQSQIDALVGQIQQGVAQSAGDLAGETIDDLTNQLSDQIYTTVKTEVSGVLNDYVNEYKGFIPWLVSSTVLFLFSSVGLIVKYFAIILAQLLLLILGKIKLVEKYTEMMPVEKYRVVENKK